jgi:hypothetical protein
MNRRVIVHAAVTSALALSVPTQLWAEEKGHRRCLQWLAINLLTTSMAEGIIATSKLMRIRALIPFFFWCGLLIFFSPYVVYKAETKQRPWLVPIIAIPMYATLVLYWAYKLFWRRSQ